MPQDDTASKVRLVRRGAQAKDPAASTNRIVAEPVEAGQCPHCKQAWKGLDVPPLGNATCAACGKAFLMPGRLDTFRLVERIGEGEMGEIYRAEDESLHRHVAIKVVRTRHADDAVIRERLRKEAMAAAKMSHPGVAQVFALGFCHGQPYLVMELLPGLDVAAKLRDDGPMEEREALQVALDITDGLRAMHAEGVTHGDIKPANIVLGKDGRAKLVDFGLSGMPRQDGSGVILGTPDYIAPELLKGVRDNTRSDIYSLGATLYHMLTGQPPFVGESPADVIMARLRKPAPQVGSIAPQVSSHTQRLVMRMIAREPEQRYLDCDAVAEDLRGAMKALESGVRPRSMTQPFVVPPVESSAPRPRLRPLPVLLIVAIALELVLVLQTYGGFRRPPRKASAPPAPAAAEVVVPVIEVAAPEAPLTRPVEVVWKSVALGNAGRRGSTGWAWRDGSLVVQGGGYDAWRGGDGCRYVQADAAGEYAFSVRVDTIADTHADARTGILARGGTSQSPSVFVGFRRNGTLFLQTRDARGREQTVRSETRAVPLPCYLRLERRGDGFTALRSMDGQSWRVFGTCSLALPDDAKVGVAVVSGKPNVLATAEFAEIRMFGASEL